MTTLPPPEPTLESLQLEITRKDQRIRFLERENERLRDRLDDLGDELDDEDQDDDQEDRLDQDSEDVARAMRLLELSAAHLCAADRAHCELWLDPDFMPTEEQVKELDLIYQACEREANLRGEGWE